MSASYPASIATPRTKENATGITYEASNTKRLYAEDVVSCDEEIVAIETELGTNVKGTFVNLRARIESLEARVTALE